MENDFSGRSGHEPVEMPLGDGALAVVHYKVENGRVVMLCTEVPQEQSELGRSWRMAFAKRCDATAKE